MAGFAMNFKIVDFVNLAGHDDAFGIYAGIFGFVALFGFPIFYWGKSLRRWPTGWVGFK